MQGCTGMYSLIVKFVEGGIEVYKADTEVYIELYWSLHWAILKVAEANGF